ncbi:hypothetical protein [Blastococcus brunescens]|uniref:PASTA domain-containing protein n=1 Tax=Blastococcus brunescens TaxID=1564165 RepID=A0ABZ1B422_9ACTN|nr:hypothetical protein [Blastococcus sp. BMG 8361]WRL64099.1 hypothetical protein U6N30_31760 [Blastococcus sp. BMG 8361]
MAALLVGAAIPVAFAATVLMVVSYDTTAQADGAATSSAAPATAVESPVEEVVAFPDLSALPLGEAIAGLKEAGAQVSASDARAEGGRSSPTGTCAPRPWWPTAAPRPTGSIWTPFLRASPAPRAGRGRLAARVSRARSGGRRGRRRHRRSSRCRWW